MTPFQRIANKINRTIAGSAKVTAEQVACVASGEERTVSHPVIASIMRELKSWVPNKTRGHKATNGEHVVWEE